MIKLEHFQNINVYQKEEYEIKQYKGNENAPVIFPSEVKFSEFAVGVNTIK